jgi:hypothetical protein
MKKLFALMTFLFAFVASYGQAPSTTTNPLFSTNVKWVQGFAPSYSLNQATTNTNNLGLLGGVTFACGSLTNFAGGVLNLPANTTSFVYLDTTNNCIPAFSSETSFNLPTQIPLYIVTTNGTQNAVIQDVRTMFQTNPFGAGCTSGNTIAQGCTGATTATGAFNNIVSPGGNLTGALSWTGGPSGTPATNTLANLGGVSFVSTTSQTLAGPLVMPSITTSSLPVVDVRSAGIVGDGMQLSGCSITAGSNNLICSTAAFSASTDISKGFAVSGAGVSSSVLVSTITAVVSPTQVTLASFAITTQTNTTVIYGTNNTVNWCSMVNCTSPNQPNFISTPTAGRILKAPRGTYLFFRTNISSGNPPTLNTRNGDILQGDGGTNTEFIQIDNTNEPAAATADFVIPNSFSNAGVITSDTGGLFVGVTGVMFQQPFNTSGGCIQTATSAGLGFVSGGEFVNNWFICNVGMKVTGNLIWIQNNTCDEGTSECIVMNGSGTTSNNITHDVSVTLNDFFLNHFAAVDMNGGADIWVTHNWFSDDFTNGLIIDTGAANFRYHIRDNDFNASTSSFASNQTHMLVQGTCTDCDSEGNTFEFGRTNDVVLTNAGIVNWLDQGNTYFNSSNAAVSGSGTLLASIDASVTGSGLTIQDDKFNTVGQYGFISTEPARLLRNQCFSPFSVATPEAGGNPTSGCFQFINANTGTIELGQNTTSSASFPAIGFISQTGTETETVVSYNNTSGFSSCAVCFDSNRAAGSWITSWDENSTNVGANGQTIWGSFFNSVTGAMSLGGSLSVGTTLSVSGGITSQAGKTVPVQSSGTQVTNQVACIKATSPITLGTCAGTVNATTGVCGTCN